MAIHSSILAWRIPGTEEPGELQSMGSKESDTTERLTYIEIRGFETAFLEEKEASGEEAGERRRRVSH